MNFLSKIPKSVTIGVVLILGILCIMISDPPTEVCDAQVEVFTESQAGRLSSLRGRVNSLWSRSAKYCQETKSLGGCAELFEVIRKTLIDIRNAPSECVPKLLKQEWLRKILADSVVLLVKIAWSEKNPELGPFMYGWMRSYELKIFCELNSRLQESLSDEEWEIFIRNTASKLPKNNDLQFSEVMQRSLFSVKCE